MNLQNQVCNEDQGQELEKLGITAKPLFCHCIVSPDPTGEKYFKTVVPTQFDLSDRALQNSTWNGPAFTVSELAMMLPNEQAIIGWEAYYNDHQGLWYCTIRDFVKWKGGATPPPVAHESEGDTMAEALASALIHCLEHGLVAPQECNANLA